MSLFNNSLTHNGLDIVETKYSKANGDIAINIKTVVFQKGLGIK